MKLRDHVTAYVSAFGLVGVAVTVTVIGFAVPSARAWLLVRLSQ